MGSPVFLRGVQTVLYPSEVRHVMERCLFVGGWG